MPNPSVYILASKLNGTLYIGVTSNLVARVWQHKQHEKQLKKWRRKWKTALIENENPEWRDLYFEII